MSQEREHEKEITYDISFLDCSISSTRHNREQSLFLAPRSICVCVCVYVCFVCYVYRDHAVPFIETSDLLPRLAREIGAIGRARHAESRASLRHRRRDARHSRRLEKRLSVTIRFGVGRVVRPRKTLPMSRLASQCTDAPYRPATARHSSSCPRDRPLEIIQRNVSRTRETHR